MRLDNSNHNPENDNVAHHSTIVIQQSPTSGCIRGVFFMVSGCILIPIIILIISVVLGLTSVNRIMDSIRQIFDTTPSAQVVSTRTIINSILPLAELVTVRTEVAKIGMSVNLDYGFASGCSHTATYAIEGEFSAGVDLGKISSEAISYDEVTHTYTLHIPGAQLTSCVIRNADRYAVETVGICLRGTNPDDSEPLVKYVALNEFRDEQLRGGILDRAQQEANLVLTNFVRALVTSDTTRTEPTIEIVFGEQDSARPLSCNPTPPGNWSQDADGKWTKTG